MPVETGTYVNDLVQSNPAGADDRSQGDNHLRLTKEVLKNTFPNASKAFRFPTTAAVQTSTVTVLFPDDQNKVFPVDTTAGAVAVNLPDPTSGGTVHEDGFAITVVRISAGNNALIINASAGQLIGSSSAYSVFGLFQVVQLVWCKLAARWLVGSPNFLEELFVETTGSGRTPLQVQHTDNTSAEQGIARFRRGNGAGLQFIINTLGDAANGVLALREYIGATVLVHKAATFIQYGLNFFVGAIGSAAPWGVLSSGHEHHQNLSAPATPQANHTYEYYTAGVAMAKDSAGTERSLEAGQIIAIVEDQKAQNTAAQTLSSGSDQIRELNTLVSVRSLAGVVQASIGSNRITLPAGTWEIEWSAPANSPSSLLQHQAFLYNQSDASVVARGQSVQSGTSTTLSTGSVVVTIPSSKSFEIRHRVSGTMTGGAAGNFGTEVYTRVVVRRA